MNQMLKLMLIGVLAFALGGCGEDAARQSGDGGEVVEGLGGGASGSGDGATTAGAGAGAAAGSWVAGAGGAAGTSWASTCWASHYPAGAGPNPPASNSANNSS